MISMWKLCGEIMQVADEEKVSQEKQVMDIVRNSMYLEVDEVTRSEYTGCMDGSDLYKERKTIKIRLLCDIDEVTHHIDEIEFEV